MSYRWDRDDDIPARRPEPGRSELLAATVLVIIALAVVLWLIWSAP